MFAGAVDGDVRAADQPCDRGGVDDAAGILPGHHRDHIFHAKKDADDIDVEHPAEGGQRVIGNSGNISLDAGVVEEDVQAAHLVHRLAHIGRDIVLAGDVGDNR